MLGDGWCDAHAPYNTLECNWDGGDCCRRDSLIIDCKDPTSPMFGQRSPLGHIQPLSVPRNPRYTVDVTRQVTLEQIATTYNNYYEFGMSKDISEAAISKGTKFLDQDSWKIQIKGLVDRPVTVSAAELIGMFALEERLYRHRCVEAWSIVVPWYGFPLAKLLDAVGVQPAAKFVKFTSWKNTTVSQVQGQYSDWPWPYVEGLTVAEARNDVAFMTVGLYQKVLPPQSGAPIRLTVPWKYGFKSIKSIRSIEFTDQIPVGFWEEVAYNEYGFWANVNPAQPHPRWSQATERELVTATYGNKLIPTEIWNGYGPFVAKMYEGPDFELLRATGRLYV